MTIEELEQKSFEQLTDDEAKLLVDHYKQLSAKFTAYEQAVKLTLNSIYGAICNKLFHFFNLDIAESITKQGKNAILYSETILNKYVNDFWHKDTAVHDKFNIKVKGKIEKPAVIYIDTDSCYVQFQDLYESIIWPDEDKKLPIDDALSKLGIVSVFDVKRVTPVTLSVFRIQYRTISAKAILAIAK